MILEGGDVKKVFLVLLLAGCATTRVKDTCKADLATCKAQNDILLEEVSKLQQKVLENERDAARYRVLHRLANDPKRLGK